jgi:hypothetical protein
MFWHLMFAHLLADYVLQSTWMVANKSKLGILILHAAIHLGTLFVVVGGGRQLVWPYLLLLVLFHFLVDFGKKYLNQIRPKWIVAPYIADQFIHYLSLWVMAVWIDSQFDPLPLPFTRTVFLFASVYLLVTYVWYISERIFAYADLSYRKEVVDQFWIRMASRAALLSGFLLFWNWVIPLVLSSTLVSSIPYLRGKNGSRALFSDLSVSVAGLILIIMAL